MSPSPAKKDKTERKTIYEQAGVEEYWIISPQGFLEIYYLENGKYVLNQTFPKAFPHIKMTLCEIFEGVIN